MKRDEVKIQYKWRLEDIYSSDEAWEAEFEKAQNTLSFSEYARKLDKKEVLLEYLKANDKYGATLDKLAAYAHLHSDEDKSNQNYAAMYSKIYSLYSKYATETAFYEPEMSKLDDEYLYSLLKDKDFSDYDYHIKRLIDNKKHAVSEAEEKLLGMAFEVFNTFSDTFDMIDNLDLPLPEIEYQGEKTKLTHGLYGVILHGDDREKRKEAYEKYYSAYKSLINTLTSTYVGSVKSDVLFSKVYKFDSSLERALYNEDVQKCVYDNLIKAVDDNLASMHRYMSDRKKIKGYDKQYFYDVYSPLVDGAELNLDYDSAYELVIKGLAVLGKEYQSLLKKAYDERWIDVEETEGKRNGAYSASCYGVHPYVLLNYKPSITDVFTIAHEMGHSLHTYFSQKNQPYFKSQYKIFVGEVASTVNEVLLLKYLLTNAKDEAMKKYLLNYYLDTMRATLHRQTMFAEFESKVHSMEESGTPLTKERLCSLYSDLGKKYYGDDIVHDDDISYEWARIPHLYFSFYVYKYATGIIAAINIATKILSEGEKAVKSYFEFLKGGSSTDPVSLLKLAGVDLTSKEPFNVAMREFENTLIEFEKLMGI